MPLLPSKFLSNWWLLSLANNSAFIAEVFNQTKVQDTSPKALIQGDIGVHVLDIAGIYFNQTITSPVLVGINNPVSLIDNIGTSGSVKYYDTFDLLLDIIKYQFRPVYPDPNTATNYSITGAIGYPVLLKSAQIQVSTETVKATLNLESDTAIAPQYFGQSANIIARTARFYDTTFTFGLIQGRVLSGDISITVDLEKVYFLGQGQSPFFAIKGYSVTGNIKLAIIPEEYITLINLYGSYERYGKLLVNTGLVQLIVAGGDAGADRVLNLGTASVLPKIEMSMQQGSIITAQVDFTSYFNRGSLPEL
jgi:hypothetical protein